jgi:hypothetical protein
VRVGAAPVPARVALYRSGALDRATGRVPWLSAAEAQCDSEGRALLPAGPGPWLLSVRAPGYAMELREVQGPRGEQRTRIEIALERVAALSGRVVSKATGEPIPLARVSAFPLLPQSRTTLPDEERVTAVSDPLGRFHLEGFRRGRVYLEASAAGYAAMSVEPGLAEEIVLRLRSAGFLVGRVVDALGRPAAGAEVLAITRWNRASAITSETGAYSLEVAPAEHRVSARRGKEAAALPVGAIVAAGQTRELPPMALTGAAALEGVVRASGGGALLDGASVSASPHGLMGDLGRATTDAQGAFAIEGLAPGTYDLDALAGTARGSRRGLVLLAGQRVRVELAASAAAAVEGLVRDRSGRAAPAAEVRAIAEDGATVWATADADGHYRLDGIPPGHASLLARRDDGGEQTREEVQLRAGETARKDLALRGLGTIEGRVTMADGSPANGARVFIATERILTVEAGQYSAKVPEGTYDVEAWIAPGEHAGARVTVEVDRTTQQDLVLSATNQRQIKGRVLEPDGTPGAFAHLSFKLAAGQGFRYAGLASEDGTFSVRGEAPGLLRAESGGRAGEAPVAESGETVVQLLASASLSGRVVGDPPVQRFALNAYPAGGRWTSRDQLSFEGDRFEVFDLPVRKTTLRVATDDHRFGSIDVELREGGAQEVEVPLQRACTLRGRLVQPDGSAPGPVKVAARSKRDDTRRYSDSDAEGRFALTDFTCGEVSFDAAKGDLRLHLRLTLSDGEDRDLGLQLLKLPRGAVGLQLAPLGDGVGVAAVVPGSPAALGGVLPGDRLVAVDGVAVQKVGDAVGRLRGGGESPVVLTLRRDGRELTLTLLRAPG